MKTYIQEHLGEEINRANVAKGFFLNQIIWPASLKKRQAKHWEAICWSSVF